VFSLGGSQLVFEPKSVEEVARFCSCRDGQFLREPYTAVDFREAQHCFRRTTKTTIFYWKASFQVEVRDRMMDCRRDWRPCRFAGMRQLTKCFPEVREVFRKFDQYSLLVH